MQIFRLTAQVESLAGKSIHVPTVFSSVSLTFSAMSDWEDLGITWDIPQTLSQIPFFILQLSMVVFILRHGRKEKSFREAFYNVFVAVTMADCTVVVAVSSRTKVGPTRRCKLKIHVNLAMNALVAHQDRADSRAELSFHLFLREDYRAQTNLSSKFRSNCL